MDRKGLSGGDRLRPRNWDLAQNLNRGLRTHHENTRSLPGIEILENREAFIEQLVESIRRIEYFTVVSSRDIAVQRTDPSESLFDPIRAAMLLHQQLQIEEAFWLAFLSVHFGKHPRDGWRLVRDIYGRLGVEGKWDWERTSSNPGEFRKWLAENEATLKNDGVSRRFGNHRKYESLNASSDTGTGAVVESYVRWVRPPRTHQQLVQESVDVAHGMSRDTFNSLYQSLDEVVRFGRTARFDYLTLLGKLGLASIEPGSTYLTGATGPLSGAKLLFGGRKDARIPPSDLDEWLTTLEGDLGLAFGMQVLEDALCNWQKSPGRFKPFRS